MGPSGSQHVLRHCAPAELPCSKRDPVSPAQHTRLPLVRIKAHSIAWDAVISGDLERPRSAPRELGAGR